MLLSLFGLSVGSMVCLMLPQLRAFGALGMVILIVLNPTLFLGLSATAGVAYWVFKK